MSQRLWLVVLIVLLAAGLRFHHLQLRSLWEDEGWTLLLSAGSTPSAIVQTMAFDQHPPLYFVAIHYWRALIGDSEFGLRSFSAFAGILSVAAFFQLGRVTFGVRTGLYAAALLAVWDFALDLSQEARQYTPLFLFVTLSCAYYFRYRANPTRANGLGWLLTSIAALYTQYMAGVVLACQLVHIILFIPRSRRSDFLIRFGTVCLAFAPWLPVFIHQNQVRWENPIYYQSGLPNTFETYVLVRDALVSRQFGLIIGLFVLGAIVVQYAPKPYFDWPSLSPAFFMLLWSMGYVSLIVYLNERREILRLQIFLLALPPILLLAAHGLAKLPPMPQYFLAAVLLAVNLTTLDARQNRPPWREVTRHVTEFHQTGEPVLMDIWVGDFSVRYYVEKQMGEATEWLSLRELRDSARDLFLPQLAAYVDDHEAFWLIRWNDDPQDYDGLLAELGFQRTASLYITHEGNKLYSHRYDRLSEARLATFGGSIDLMKAAVGGELRGGEKLTISLWWVARSTPTLDYSVSVFVIDEHGQLLAQQDGPPLKGLAPTSTWGVDEIHFDQHQLTLPALRAGDSYWLGVRLYWYAEPDKPLGVTSKQDGIEQETFATIEAFQGK